MKGALFECGIRNLDRNNKLVFFECTIGVNVFVRFDLGDRLKINKKFLCTKNSDLFVE